jgi:hypothetical protein
MASGVPATPIVQMLDMSSPRGARARPWCDDVTMSVEGIYVTLVDRGTLELPAGLCRRRGLDRLRARMRVVERSDGVIELHPVDATAAPGTPRDARVWTQRWQHVAGRSGVGVALGRSAVNDRVEELLDALEASIGG